MYCAYDTFFLIEYAMIPHGFDIEETDYDIISSDPGHCFGFTGQAGIYSGTELVASKV